jgi:hypothetical protein
MTNILFDNLKRGGLTKNQKLICDALTEKLNKTGLSLDDQDAICNVIGQIKIGTGLINIPE